MLSISTYLGKRFWSLVFLTIGSPLIRFIFCSFCPAFAPAPPSLCMAPQVPALCWVLLIGGLELPLVSGQLLLHFVILWVMNRESTGRVQLSVAFPKEPLCQDWFPLVWGEQTYERNKLNQFAIAWKPGQRPKRAQCLLTNPFSSSYPLVRLLHLILRGKRERGEEFKEKVGIAWLQLCVTSMQ